MKTLLLLLAFFLVPVSSQPLPVNFAHLTHLTERIAFQGDTVAIVHVYANYPSYDWVGAADSGPEGVACVDDAARAAVVFLRHYELTGDTLSLSRAALLLKFVERMETPDGMFYNFLLEDHTINMTGSTSFKSFGWWASRAVWSLSMGSRLFRASDPRFAERLQSCVERTFPHIDSLLLRYQRSRSVNGFRIPTWLPYESGADVSSELLLGLIEYAKVKPGARVRSYITKIAAGLMAMQDGDETRPPFALHRSWGTTWHMWGNGQTQALASAGRLLNDRRMVRSAEREARGWYARLLIGGFKKEMDLADSSALRTYEQIAYAVRPMAVGLLRLYDATKNRLYLRMAGLAASWLFGNNVLGVPMFDTATGRCFDGIRDAETLNKNSGAESTIEALATIVELSRYPLAQHYLPYVRVSARESPGALEAVFQAKGLPDVMLAINTRTGQLSLSERAAIAPREGVK